MRGFFVPVQEIVLYCSEHLVKPQHAGRRTLLQQIFIQLLRRMSSYQLINCLL
jgi:hypothetical protein